MNKVVPDGQALAEALKIAQNWKILSTKDAKEGMKAFAEKRKPVFDGT